LTVSVIMAKYLSVMNKSAILPSPFIIIIVAHLSSQGDRVRGSTLVQEHQQRVGPHQVVLLVAVLVRAH